MQVEGGGASVALCCVQICSVFLHQVSMDLVLAMLIVHAAL